MTLMNGMPRTTQRKTLASQLDRMDNILDALSDGLNEAVASTVEQAVGAAVSSTVQTVLTELLTNPIVLARLREILAPAPSVAPVAIAVPQPVNRVPYSTRLRAHFQKARKRFGILLSQTRAKMSGLAGKVKGWTCGLATKVGACLRMAKPYQKALLVSAGIGVACAVTGYFAGPWFAAAAAWVAGFVTTLGVQAGIAFRRMMNIGESV